MLIDTVIIPVGGKGTRMASVSPTCPKPLLQVQGKTIICHTLDSLKDFCFKQVIFTLSHESAVFADYLDSIKSSYPFNITTFVEPYPLGEAGALWQLRDSLPANFLVINGDLIFSIDFNRLFAFHFRNNADITVVTHTSTHPEDSDLVSTSFGDIVSDLYLKSSPNHEFNSKLAYLGNAGIVCIRSSTLDSINPPPKDSATTSIFQYLVHASFKSSLHIFSYNTTEYIKDMGTPARFRQVGEDLVNGLPSRLSYENQQSALFLDRDGTLNHCEKGNYIVSSDDLVFFEDRIKSIAKLSTQYNLVCLVTNQPQLAMGFLSFKNLEHIHACLVSYALRLGLKIDVISFCPHHPHSGFSGEIPYLKTNCFCRKPLPGQFLEQIFLRNIDLKSSLMIGDSHSDYVASTSINLPYLDVTTLD